MEHIWKICLLVCSIMLVPISAHAESDKTDKEIIQALIKQSISAYSGICACPYSVNRGGRKCGRSSAYSKPGGASPLCYPRDITPNMIQQYRNRQL